MDRLAGEFNITARYNGGANAGHTVVIGDKKHVFHLIPCGLLYPHTINILGNGVVIHMQTLDQELKELEKGGTSWNNRLLISNRAHIITQMHLATDEVLENTGFIGTTKRGIGPAYSMKALRHGLRIADLLEWDEFVKKYKALQGDMKKYFGLADFNPEKELTEIKAIRDTLVQQNAIVDCSYYLHKAVAEKKRILIEGANATMLDIDHGTYPFVTSSSTNVGGACTGLGFPPSNIDSVIGVCKSYVTRVGSGPFPTELKDATGDLLQTTGKEFGATTGRKRRCGWFDLNLLRYSAQLNNLNSIMLSKLDVLNNMKELKVGVAYKIGGKEVKFEYPPTIEELAKVEVVYENLPPWKGDLLRCTKYNELPLEAKNYVEFIEKQSGVKITWIGTGPERNQMILKN